MKCSTFASVCSLEYSSFSWICQAACFFNFNRAWCVRNAAWIFDADLSTRMTGEHVVDIDLCFSHSLTRVIQQNCVGTWRRGELCYHFHFIGSIRNGSHLRNDLNRSVKATINDRIFFVGRQTRIDCDSCATFRAFYWKCDEYEKGPSTICGSVLFIFAYGSFSILLEERIPSFVRIWCLMAFT